MTTVLITTLVLFAGSTGIWAQSLPETLPVWPNHEVPDGWSIEEQETSTTTNGVTRIRAVSEPTLTYFRALGESPSDMAVVVCPGGGYNILAFDKEGLEVAQFLAEHGIHAFVLKYRLPRTDEATRYGPGLQDAQRAISSLRHRASEMGIAPHKIGIMGFSAGGHLSAVTATRFEERHYQPTDAVDQMSCRPDFCGLIYPAYLVDKESQSTVSPELTVSSNTPPTFLVQTSDDPVTVENSIQYYLELKQFQVPAQVHVFHQGPHGYGLRSKDKPVGTWPHRMVEWLDSLEFSPVATASSDSAGIASASGSPTTNVYLSIGGENKIAVYYQDPPTGTLTLMQTIKTDGQPGSLAMSADKRFLYAALRSTQQVASFAVDFFDGSLRLLGNCKVAGNAVYIQPDTSGQHLFYASYGDNEAAVYPIGIDGLVRPKFTWKATTQSHPHSIGARPHHPSLVVIPNTGSSIVQTYYFDNQAGSLSLASTTAMPDKTGQRHFVFGEQHFFTVNETASSVTAYKYAGNDGSFKPQQTLSTLPSAHEGHNSCADIHLTPDSRFLYVSNRGHDSIAGFALGSNERPLTFLGTTATEQTPREFAIDPAGSYLYAAGQKSGNVAAYKIHNDGNLERFATYAVGKNPTWVLATTISRP